MHLDCKLFKLGFFSSKISIVSHIEGETDRIIKRKQGKNVKYPVS